MKALIGTFNQEKALGPSDCTTSPINRLHSTSTLCKVQRHGVLLAALRDIVPETTQYCDSVDDFIYLGGGNPNSIL